MLDCVKRMKFEFDIGQEEKHTVRFIYSKIWGTRSIKVDNQIVKRRILPFFVNFSGIILIVVFIYFQFQGIVFIKKMGESYINWNLKQILCVV